MIYQTIAQLLPKPLHTWTTSDVTTWLRTISLDHCIPKFQENNIDGSCIHLLDQADLENQLGIKSKIIAKKLMKWIHEGFQQFDCYLLQKQLKIDASRRVPAVSVERGVTSLIREPFKRPDLSFSEGKGPQSDPELLIRVYQGSTSELINFKPICSSTEIFRIGKSSQNHLIVSQETANPFHAEIKYLEGQFRIRDANSVSGTFLKAQTKEKLEQFMTIELGSYHFIISRVDALNQLLTVSISNTVEPNAYPIKQVIYNFNTHKSFKIGRKFEVPGVPGLIFAEDEHMSGLHAKLHIISSQFYVEDMQSTNGTWIKLSQPESWLPLRTNSVFKIGAVSTYQCKIKDKDSGVNNTEADYRCFKCMKNVANCLYLPCRHNRICEGCSQMAKQCVVCGCLVEQIIKIYI